MIVVLHAFVHYVITSDNALSVECPICISSCLFNKEIKNSSFLKNFCEALYVLGHLKS